jgi:bacillithiol system protein YtxJ
MAVQPARITTRVELDRAFDASTRAPVLIFKHSLTCPISAWALRTYEEFLAERDADAVLYTLIEIQKARDVADEVAVRTGVRHESPQVLLVHDGRAVWNASHWEITGDSLRAALDDAGG